MKQVINYTLYFTMQSFELKKSFIFETGYP